MPELKTVLPEAVPQCRDIEGYVDPPSLRCGATSPLGEPKHREGFFGDQTCLREVRSVGQPSRRFSFCIRHSPRPATIVGIPPMEDFYIGPDMSG